LKKNTIYNYYKRRLRKKLAITGGKFVVLSSTLKKELITFIPEHSIDVIPFSVYDPTLKDESKNNTSLRICLPGMVSEFRRDYYSIIKILLENITDFRNKIEIVLLGFISKKEFGFRVIKEFQKLIDEGLTVAYFDQDFIPIDIYDHELSKADIILGNIRTSIDAYSKYGKTKETGIPFTMIRAGKPGILPAEYNFIKEIESSTIQFENYEELKDILIDLVNNKDKLILLKEEALKNSLKFEPAKLYNELMLNQF
jgi:hypothetical protein